MAGRRRPDNRQFPAFSRPQSVYCTPRRAGRPDRGGSAMNIGDAHGNRPLLSEAEWQVRVDLAACYRLVAMHGWDDVLATHISARVPEQEDVFLINPFGLTFEEITASSLRRVDKDGAVLDESPYRANPAGFTIHSAVHQARPDAGCVIHLHSLDGMAVSATAEGLLPLDRKSTRLNSSH